MRLLAQICQGRHEYAQAENLFRELLLIQKKQPDYNYSPISTLETTNGLIQALWQGKRFEDAESLCCEVLDTTM